MKTQFILLTLVLCLFACKKDDDTPGNFQTPLPPATQNGAGTFACYVNGKAFIDTDKQFNCFYQLIDGEYYFGIQGQDDIDEWFLSITLSTYAIPLQEGKTYILLNKKEGDSRGGIRVEPNSGNGNDSEFVSTSKDNPGSLTITRFDKEKSIVSGTFSFKVTNPFTKEILEVSEGRFDSYFSN